ncbi:MAG: hypothetical protein ABGY24_16060 [bacterium]
MSVVFDVFDVVVVEVVVEVVEVVWSGNGRIGASEDHRWEWSERVERW